VSLPPRGFEENDAEGSACESAKMTRDIGG